MKVKAFLLFLAVVFVSTGHAESTERPEDVIKKVFGADMVSAKVFNLTSRQVAFVKANLDGAEAIVKKTCKIYFAYKGKKTVGAAMVDNEPDKWGDNSVVVCIDPFTFRIKRVDTIFETTDKYKIRVRKNRGFLNQFSGRKLDEKIHLGEEINAVSGATITSRADTLSTKKIMLLYRLIAASWSKKKR
jgi:Na+-translocating ferredoxin:NAD+ oxidoreductase RnfG subunit